MQPDGQQVAAAMGAMRQDASMWTDMAAELAHAAAVADRLDLSALHFSFIADKLGMTGLYTEIQDRLSGLMRDGSAEFTAIATALTTAANGYEADEAAAVHRMRGIY